MPRHLVFGNGSLLVGIDEHYVIRDLFYPYVGMFNHLAGHAIRFGVWVDGRYAWVGPEWSTEMRYEAGSLIGHTTLRHDGLGLELTIRESVSPLHPIYVRQMAVRDLSGHDRRVRLFFSHDLRLAETDIGDTAYYDAFLDAVIHYKGPHWLLFGGEAGGRGIAQYTTGLKDFQHHVGTYLDAEDGSLEGNPISQGSVDSTLGLELDVAANGEAMASYWLVCGRDRSDAAMLLDLLRTSGAANILEDTGRFHQSWIKRHEPDLANLGPELRELFERSLFIVRTQIDNNGAILAANDSDIMKTNRATYSFMWPRDGAFVTTVLDRLGYQQLGRRFFRFCQRILPEDRPMLLHKYAPDGTLGSSWHPWVVDGQPDFPFQQDETALVIYALWEHYRRYADLEFLLDMYDSFVKPAMAFMIDHRDPATDLPLPSWDLWEERRGVHTNTVAAVIAAFRAAAEMADLFADENGPMWAQAAEAMTAGLREHLYSRELGCFLRCLRCVNGDLVPDTTTDSSVLAVALLGILPGDAPEVTSSLEAIERDLRIRSHVGGYARYQDDYYFRQTDAYAGNPWIICTMWVAQLKIRRASTRAELEQAAQWLEWTRRHATPTGVLSEQIHPDTGQALSVSPLTWSHAEFLATCLDFLEAKARIG